LQHKLLHMKPNLFRSIYNSLTETFPLLPRIRRSFIGLLVLCVLFFMIDYSKKDSITVSTYPVENGPYFNHPVSTYPSGHVQLTGLLIISHPTVLQKILLPNADTGFDLFMLLFIVIGSIIIILIVPKLQQQTLFRKDISNSIRLLGYLIMLHGILSTYRTFKYIPDQIEYLTNNEFTGSSTFPIIMYAEFYVSLMVIALASLYKRGIKLQEEQDLTV